MTAAKPQVSGQPAKQTVCHWASKYLLIIASSALVSACSGGNTGSVEIESSSEVLTSLIDSGPERQSSSRSANLSFSGAGVSRFECRLDLSDWVTCSSPRGYSDLELGEHEFSVRAFDASDQLLATDDWDWLIEPPEPADEQAPQTSLDSTPPALTQSTTANFSFSANETATFECRIDSGSWQSCTSPASHTGLAVGNHQFDVRATDAANNTDTSPATWNWTIQATEVSTCPDGAQRWSDPATWGGQVPGVGENVTIADGQSVALDDDTAPLAGLTIWGSLEFCREDLALTADWVMVHGRLDIGSENHPFEQQATITLTGDDTQQSIMGMGTRGLMVMGGQLELHGTPPQTVWSKINAHAAAGTTQLTMMEDVDWQAGDQLVIAPTDYYFVGASEQLDLAGVNGSNLTLENPLQDFRWGVMQYATSSGISLSPDGSLTPPQDPAGGQSATELDQRAEVGNLTRNIVIQAPDDSVWQSEGFGAHVMIMQLSSQAHINGVEFRRVGQAGILGRYPFHWHRLSYRDDGVELGDATGHYVRNSAIHNSMNRCITIHATNGTEVSNNVCYNVRGHGIFFEDAVERRNVVEGNLVLHTRNPEAADLLKVHEGPAPFGNLGTGASGLWVSNPDNTVRNNTAADAEGFGLWMAFPAAPVASSSNVDMIPNRLELGNFDYNTVHSNRRQGVMFDNVEIDDNGNVRDLMYVSTVDQLPSDRPYPNVRRATITGGSTWKNSSHGIWNRVFRPDYLNWTSADNMGRFFAGSAGEGQIAKALMVGTSLNSLNGRPAFHEDTTAFASYHSAFDIHHNLVMHFPLIPGAEFSGMYAMHDYYIRPVEMGQIRSPGNRLIDSHPGFRSNAPAPQYMTLSGAYLDANAMWGPENNWVVYDEPFLTHGLNCQDVLPSPDSNAVSCDGEFYGANDFVLNQANDRQRDFMAIDVTRFDDNNPDLVVGNWSMGTAQQGALLDHMRHFAVQHGGTYLLDFPDEVAPPTDVAMSIEHARHQENNFVLGISFSGLEPAQVYGSTFYNYDAPGHDTAGDFELKKNYTAIVDQGSDAANRQAVIDSDGWEYWQDTANNIVWIKVAGANLQPHSWEPEHYDEDDDEFLYWEWTLRVW